MYMKKMYIYILSIHMVHGYGEEKNEKLHIFIVGKKWSFQHKVIMSGYYFVTFTN